MSVIVLCFVVRYFMSILVLQSPWWGRESWLLCLICLSGVSWWLSGSSSRCHGIVCGLWLWYFLIILTIFESRAKKQKNPLFVWECERKIHPLVSLYTRILVHYANSKFHCSNKEAQLHSGTAGLNFMLSLHDLPFFVCLQVPSISCLNLKASLLCCYPCK